MPGFRARTFTPELVKQPGRSWICSGQPAAGRWPRRRWAPGNVRPSSEAQIALRFPGPPGAAGSPAVPHIDGISAPGNGVPPGTLYHFTALGGVFLSDVTGARPGQPHGLAGVAPGGQAFFREQGAAG